MKRIGEGGKVLPVPYIAILRVCIELLGALHTQKMSWMAGRQIYGTESRHWAPANVPGS